MATFGYERIPPLMRTEFLSVDPCILPENQRYHDLINGMSQCSIANQICIDVWNDQNKFLYLEEHAVVWMIMCRYSRVRCDREWGGVNVNVKRKVYSAVVRPSQMYGAKTCAAKMAQELRCRTVYLDIHHFTKA